MKVFKLGGMGHDEQASIVSKFLYAVVSVATGGVVAAQRAGAAYQVTAGKTLRVTELQAALGSSYASLGITLVYADDAAITTNVVACDAVVPAFPTTFTGVAKVACYASIPAGKYVGFKNYSAGNAAANITVIGFEE